MRRKLSLYRQVFDQVFAKIDWRRILLFGSVFLGTYETAADYWHQVPPTLELVGMTGALLPSWGWALIITSTAALVFLEIAAQQVKQAQDLVLEQRLSNRGRWDVPFYRRAPIEFSEWSHFLTVSGRPLVYSVPQDLQKRWNVDPDLAGRTVFRILGFRLVGRNRLGKPLKIKGGLIKSHHNDEQLKLLINGKLIEGGLEIAPGAEFELTAKLPLYKPNLEGQLTQMEGIPIRVFADQYSHLYLVVRTEKGTYSTEITRRDVGEFMMQRIGHEWGKAPRTPTATEVAA